MPSEAARAGFDSSASRSLLVSVGLRPTLARLQVLHVLRVHAPKRLDASQVFAVLHASHVPVSHGGVYRVLREMSRAGLIVASWGPGRLAGKLSYGVVEGPSAHAVHLLCLGCGQLATVDDPGSLERLLQSGRKQGLQFSLQSLTIQGTCIACERSKPGLAGRPVQAGREAAR